MATILVTSIELCLIWLVIYFICVIVLYDLSTPSVLANMVLVPKKKPCPDRLSTLWFLVVLCIIHNKCVKLDVIYKGIAVSGL